MTSKTFLTFGLTRLRSEMIYVRNNRFKSFPYGVQLIKINLQGLYE